jgi:hypothetical protein
MRQGRQADDRKQGKIYIVTLPVRNSALRGREGSIPDYPDMKIFLADGNGAPPPGLKRVRACRPTMKAGYRPGPPINSKGAAGGDA